MIGCEYVGRPTNLHIRGGEIMRFFKKVKDFFHGDSELRNFLVGIFWFAVAGMIFLIFLLGI
jgi:hypothetical protein